MRWWKKAIIYPLLLVPLAAIGCRNPTQPKLDVPKTSKPEPPKSPVALPDTTHVITLDELAGINSIGPDSITFSQKVDYSPGDILDIDSCKQAEYGKLVKVTSVSGNVVHTTSATIEEAVKNISYETDFSINTSKSARGVSAQINVPFNNLVVYKEKGKNSSLENKVVANGGFSLKLDGHMKIDIKHFKLQDFLIQGSGQDKLDLKLNSNVNNPNVSWNDTVATYDGIPPIRIVLPTVPPFPIIIKPELDAFIGLNGSLSVQSGAEIKQNAYLKVGMSYDGKSWSPIESSTRAFEFFPPSTNLVDMKAFAGADAKFLLYGAAGFYFGPDIYARLASNSNSVNIYGGLEATLGADVQLLGRTLADYHRQISIYETLLKTIKKNSGNNDGGDNGGTSKLAGYKILVASGNDSIVKDSDYPQIYLINSDGSDRRPLTSFHTSFGNFQPRESPDGKKIAFVYPNGSYGLDIYTMNADGTDMKDITKMTGTDSLFRWSPDGKIFYSRRDDSSSGFNGIWEMNSDGSNKNQLNLPLISQKPSISPDGSKIAYSAIDGKGDWGLYMGDLNGHTVSNQHLVFSGGQEGNASWSPDGTQIVYESRKDGNLEIYKANANGSNPVNLTRNSALDAQPSWSKNGNKILFISNRGGHNEPYIMNSNGLDVQRIPTINHFTESSPTFFY